MLEAKLAGQEVAKPEPVPETPVVDLMDALKKSVAEVQQRGSADGKPKAAPKRTRRRAAAGSRKS
jgi:non-homologous end joining protein Ku